MSLVTSMLSGILRLDYIHKFIRTDSFIRFIDKFDIDKNAKVEIFLTSNITSDQLLMNDVTNTYILNEVAKHEKNPTEKESQ